MPSRSSRRRHESRSRSRSRRRHTQESRRDRDRDRDRDRSTRDRDRRDRDRDRDRSDRDRRQTRSGSRSRSRRRGEGGGSSALALPEREKPKLDKRRSGWDEPPPEMAPGAELLAAGAAAGAAIFGGKPTSIQAVLEQQKAMLAAKGTGPLPVLVPPRPSDPNAQLAAIAGVDPVIQAAIAKARAAALATCSDPKQLQLAKAPGPGAGKGGGGGGGGCGQPGSPPLAPLLTKPQLPKLDASQIAAAQAAASLSAGKPGAWPPGAVFRPPTSKLGVLPLLQAPPKGSATSSVGNVAQMASLTSKSLSVPGAMADANSKTPAVVGLKGFENMKEVSPALAALMQGSLA